MLLLKHHFQKTAISVPERKYAKMSKIPCVLQTSPRISGRLWDFDGNQVKRFSEGGVSSVEVDPQGKILEVKVKDGEKIIGAQFNSDNQAVLWTEKGNIYKLNFGQNRY